MEKEMKSYTLNKVNFLSSLLLSATLALSVTAGSFDNEPKQEPAKRQRLIDQKGGKLEKLLRQKREPRRPLVNRARRTKSVTLSSGVTLPYVEQGDPAGVPVLLLHGYTDSWRSFELVLPHLPASMHAFALTQRGHGEATRPVASYHPREFAADVAAFMDALKLKSAVIAGHSMGSYIAHRFALDYPERTRGLVLLGSFTKLRGNPGVQEMWDTVVSKLKDPVDPRFVRDFQRSTLNKPVPPAYFDTVVRESLKVPARVWRAALAALMEADFSSELGRIKAPTLILWGDRETYFLRPDQEALVAAIPGARLVVYPGAGHALHWEEPERFAADLTGFVEKLVEKPAE
jgi:non-heme chloroperoxidase